MPHATAPPTVEFPVTHTRSRCTVHFGIEGTFWGGEESGVAAATRRLAMRAVEIATQHEYVLLVSRRYAGANPGSRCLPNAERILTRVHAGGWRVAWQQGLLPFVARRRRFDALYCPCYTVPLLAPGPFVLTVHDLIVWKRPDVCAVKNVVHLRTLVAASVRRAHFVTVPTQSVREDLIEILRVPEHKIRVIPWWVSEDIQRVNAVVAAKHVAATYGLRTPFVLFVGALERKKNLETLLDAMQHVDCPLVFVGPDRSGPLYGSRLRRAMQRGRCRYLGFVPASELGPLYSAAAVVALPSHVEGFGLTALEAMACGTPLVFSRTPALLEVCGNAGLPVSATDAEALAAAIQRALEDDSLRASLVSRGLERARAFTSEAPVRAFVSTLEDAARSSGSQPRCHDAA